MWFLLSILGIYLVASALVALAVFWNRQPGVAPGSGAGSLTRFFLVCLRLAIGWHFLVEGASKADTWTGEPYLRESAGPAAPFFRWIAGDAVRDRATLGPSGEFPEELAEEWQAYFDRFQRHYELTQEQQNRAQIVFDQAKSNTLTWLKSGTKIVQLPSSQPPPLTAEMTVSQRLEAYESKEERARELEENELPYYGPAVFSKWKEAKADANKIRNDLRADLAQQTAAMKQSLADVLTSEQKQLAPIKGPTAPSLTQWSRLDWSDFSVKWGLIVVGGCLLLGLFTRTACVAGALLLLMFYLAMPPLPGLPENPRSEGHYLLINKNLVEMLALLALATTYSGRWAGLDGLIHFLNPWRRSEPAVVAIPGQFTDCDDSTEVNPAANVVSARDADATVTISPRDTQTQPPAERPVPGSVSVAGVGSVPKETSHGS
jgi:uncharacterized membrane protein YphA (DoxX/SURF4 family)